jgi:hypothetical protein
LFRHDFGLLATLAEPEKIALLPLPFTFGAFHPAESSFARAFMPHFGQT